MKPHTHTLHPLSYPWFTALVIGLAAVSVRAELPVVQEFIFDSAPFPSCHASTICELGDGTLIAAWFGGRDEGEPDVGIWISIKLPGKTWSAPREVANGVQYRTPDGETKRHPCWNPVLFVAAKGKVILFYKCGPSPRTWWGMKTISRDGGKTWSTPCRLPEGILGPVKNKPVRLADGSLFAGSSSEHDGWRVHFERTSDRGRSWTRIGPINDGKQISAIQPSLLIHPGGKLQALGRSRQGKLWTSWSDDGGNHWSSMELLEVPNPNAGTDAVTLKDGRHLLVYNPTTRGRTPLAVAISRDGRKWRRIAVLADTPGEYSYPAVIQTADGSVHITYTWKRKRIRHAVIKSADLAKLSAGEGN